MLGNLNSKRDWGYTPEYCEGMWGILQHSEADDFILATNETHTIREFLEFAFSELGIELEWCSSKSNEIGIIRHIDTKKISVLIHGCDNIPRHVNKGDVIIESSSLYYRPTEVDLLIGNSAKAESKIGWKAKTKFNELLILRKSIIFNQVRHSSIFLIC